jgi:hypothetical protein
VKKMRATGAIPPTSPRDPSRAAVQKPRHDHFDLLLAVVKATSAEEVARLWPGVPRALRELRQELQYLKRPTSKGGDGFEFREFEPGVQMMRLAHYLCKSTALSQERRDALERGIAAILTFKK